MADITKCLNGDKCDKRDTCYRWTATSGVRQSYAELYIDGMECKDFMWNCKNE